MSPLWQERSQLAGCRKRLAEAKDKKVHAVDGAPSTATVAAVEETEVIDEAGISGNCSDEENNSDDGNEAWVLSVEGNDKPVDAEFLPHDSACEEHTCPWNFAEGGRDSGPSNVELRNADGLSIPSGRKVMVSYDVLGPGGCVILHAQPPFVQSDIRRPLLSAGKLTKSRAEVKFGDKNSRVDLQTDPGVQRVPVLVKGKTIGLSIQKTDAWIIPEANDRAPHAVVAPVDEEIGREEAVCHELQTNHQLMNEHAMKSHTHLPYQPWCAWCVMGKGRAKPHLQRPVESVRVPEFEMDFCYLLQDPKQRHQPGVQAWATTLVMVDVAAQNPLCALDEV